MSETTTRDRLLTHIEAERAWWRDLVDEIGEARMTEPGPMGDWTFKDLAAHLLGWRERTISRLEAGAAGRDAPSPWPGELHDDDSINAWIQERSRDRSVREVLDDVDRSYQRLANALAALPEEALTDPNAVPELEGESLAETDFFSHVHDEHEPSIRVWLAKGA